MKQKKYLLLLLIVLLIIFNLKKTEEKFTNKIPIYCIIKHIDNRYIKMNKEHFGKININHLLK